MSAVALNRITIALGFIGIAIAGYLSLGHILNISLPCGPSHGCDIVARHASSYLTGDPVNGGIPVAYLGVLGYVVLTVLSVIRGARGVDRTRPLVWIGFVLSAAGAAYSGYLTYVALYTIHATCLWCIASAITMVLTTVVYAAMLQTEAPAQVSEQSKSVDLVFSSAMFLLATLALGAGVIQLKNSGAHLDPGLLNTIDSGKVDLVGKDSHIMGPADAPVTIVEFADLLCPACRETFPKLDELVRNGNGKLRLVFHHFPLVTNPEHRMALPAATIAEIAAEDGKFWNFVSAMYTRQTQDLQTPDSILEVAQSVGMDMAKVKKRLEDENDPALLRVTADMNLGNTLKIASTPTLVLMANGVKSRNITPSNLQETLAEEPYASLLKGGGSGSK